MKKIIILIALLASLAACDNDCSFERGEVSKVEADIQIKKEKADALITTIKNIDQDDAQQIVDLDQMSAELDMILTDIALQEIDLEDYKRRHCDCF